MRSGGNAQETVSPPSFPPSTLSKRKAEGLLLYIFLRRETGVSVSASISAQTGITLAVFAWFRNSTMSGNSLISMDVPFYVIAKNIEYKIHHRGTEDTE